MKKFYTIIALISFIVGNSQVVITGLMDGTRSGGNPKALELYVNGTVDLSDYSLWRSSNGGAWSSQGALSGIYTDRFVYVGGTGNDGQTIFGQVFGTQGVFADVIFMGGLNGNGDEGFRIVKISDSSVVDQVWTMDTNDAYKDSYMKRKNDTGPDGDWVIANWTLAGNGALSGKTDAEHATAFAAGTYTNSTFSINYFDNLGLSVYPNPVQTKLNFSGLTSSVQATVFDMLGKRLLQSEVINNLDVSSLKSGLYMVEIKNENSAKVFNILKK